MNNSFRETAAHVTPSNNCDSKYGADNNENNVVYVHLLNVLNVYIYKYDKYFIKT